MFYLQVHRCGCLAGDAFTLNAWGGICIRKLSLASPNMTSSLHADAFQLCTFVEHSPLHVHFSCVDAFEFVPCWSVPVHIVVTTVCSCKAEVQSLGMSCWPWISWIDLLTLSLVNWWSVRHRDSQPLEIDWTWLWCVERLWPEFGASNTKADGSLSFLLVVGMQLFSQCWILLGTETRVLQSFEVMWLDFV